MKAYLWTTGTVFGLIVLAHLARVIMESRALAKDPFYIVITVVAAALSVWAFRLIRASSAT